jgi:transposase InsO family protein
MPWKVCSSMSERAEFVQLASQEGANVAELCRRYGISRKTGYKWLSRSGGAEGVAELADRSRRPRRSPERSSAAVEANVVRLRHEHPAWGARKLRARLQHLGCTMPAASTVHAILERHELIDKTTPHQPPFRRFEAPRPNALWQMDFKGHFGLADGTRCHPLTVLDDHSRFCVVLAACADEQRATVQGHLQTAFARYGLPERMLMDNGPPWGNSSDERYTVLGAWLLRLGIALSHGRPCHPQTQGKDERFHRTLNAEVIQGAMIADLPACAHQFQPWRQMYNEERPHEALGQAPPITRYRVSLRPWPKELPPIVYGPDDETRRVQQGGMARFRGWDVRVGKAFIGLDVAFRREHVDGWSVYFCRERIGYWSPPVENFRRRGRVGRERATRPIGGSPPADPSPAFLPTTRDSEPGSASEC